MLETRNVFSQPSQSIGWMSLILGIQFFLTACDSGGKIEFHDGVRTGQQGVSTITLVPASVPLATEPGKNRSNGYHAKLEINTKKGQVLRSPSGYEVRLHNTRRAQ